MMGGTSEQNSTNGQAANISNEEGYSPLTILDIITVLKGRWVIDILFQISLQILIFS